MKADISKRNRGFTGKHRFVLSMLLTAFSMLPASASTPRADAGDALRRAKKDTDKVIKEVTTMLQMSGRWAPTPKGDDMQLCQSLQSFQQQLDRLEKDNSSQRGLSVVQSELQQVQFMTMNLDQQIMKASAGGGFVRSWSAVKSDLNTASQIINPFVYGRASLYDVDPTAPPIVPSSNPFANNSQNQFNGSGGYYPGPQPYSPNNINNNFVIAPNSRRVQGYLRSAESILDRLVPDISAFLQSAGKWPPQQGTAEMQLCQELQYLQHQMRDFNDGMNNQTPYPVMQTKIQQLSYSFGNLDRLFFQVGASGEINAKWNELRQRLNDVYQAFYSSDTPQYWSR